MVGIVRQVPIRDWKEAGSNKRLERGGYYHDYIFILKFFCLYRSKLQCTLWFQVVGRTYFGKVVVEKRRERLSDCYA